MTTSVSTPNDIQVGTLDEGEALGDTHRQGQLPEKTYFRDDTEPEEDEVERRHRQEQQEELPNNTYGTQTPPPFFLSANLHPANKPDTDPPQHFLPTYGKLRASDSSIDEQTPSDVGRYRNASSTTHDSSRDTDGSQDSDVESIDSEQSATSARSLPSSDTRTIGGDSHSTISSSSAGTSSGRPLLRPFLKNPTTTLLVPNLTDSSDQLPTANVPYLHKFGTQAELFPATDSSSSSSALPEIASISSPQLVQQVPQTEAAPAFHTAAAGKESGSAHFSAFTNSHHQASSNNAPMFYRAGNGGDEDASAFGNDAEELISGEERKDSPPPPELQILQPIQVRAMPFWFYVLMITCISMIGFGSYAAYDAVSAVQEQLMKDLNLTPSQFGLLYSVYALPNVILVIFGGTLVDRWGAHIVGLLTTGAIAIGAILVAWAPTMTLFTLKGRFIVMLVGRFIFGVGAESSYVVQNSMCVKWFLGDYLATAMAIAAVGTRLGSIGSYALAPRIVSASSNVSQGYTRVLWIAALTCFISFLSVIGYIILRQIAKTWLLVNKFDANSLELADQLDLYERAGPATPRTMTDDDEIIELDTDSHAQESSFSGPQDDNDDSHHHQNGATKPGMLRCIWNETKEVLLHIKGFSSLFWGCAILGAFTYGIVLGFRAVVSEEIGTRYTLTPEKSGLLMATIDITALFASPAIGWLIDWTYKMGWVTLIGNAFSVASFLFLMPKLVSPYLGIVLLGFSSAIVPGAIYPAVSVLTNASLEGLAFGVMSSIINLCNLALNPIIGYTLQASWFWMCFFLTTLSLISVGVALWWILKDAKSENPRLDRARDWSRERRWISTHIPALSHICS